LSNVGPDALYNNSLKVLNKLKTAGKSPAGFLKDEGVWGDLGTFQKAAQDGIDEESAVIKQAAYNAEGGTTGDVIKQKAVAALAQKYGDLYSPKEIEQLVEDVPVTRLKTAKAEVPWVDVDGVRSALGNLVGDHKWLSTTPSDETQAAQAVYMALSNAV